MALIGTPFGFSQSGSIVGHCEAGAVKRAFGCAALAPVSLAISGVHLFPCQSRHSAGGSSVMPSHHTPPSGVSATLVKIEFFESAIIAHRPNFPTLESSWWYQHGKVCLTASTGKGRGDISLLTLRILDPDNQ